MSDGTIDAKEYKRLVAKEKRERFENALALELGSLGLGRFEREYMFAKEANRPEFSKRRWRLDFYFPERRLAIEVEGGIWTGGAHGRPSNIERDIEKHNLLNVLGITVLRVPTKWIRNGTARRRIKHYIDELDSEHVSQSSLESR